MRSNGEEQDKPSAAGDKNPRRSGTSILGAVMLAVGDIVEPEKTGVEIVQSSDDPLDDLPFQVDFGDLPLLD